jgi:virginiamycin A acetyltransferase
MIELAPGAKVSGLADIEDSTRGSRVVIFDGLHIDAFVKINIVCGTGDVWI